jgi:hypothetical protein
MPYKNIEDTYASQEAHRARNKDKLWELLERSSCKDCGLADPRVLEFDHLPEFDKKFVIARAVSGSTRAWKSIQKEIDKCEVVCSNCHKIRTQTRGNYGRHQRFTRA